MIRIRVGIKSLNSRLDYTCHSKTLIFLFGPFLSCSGVTVSLESHRMGSTVGVEIVVSF